MSKFSSLYTGFSSQSLLSLSLSLCSHASEAAAGCLGVSVTSHRGPCHLIFPWRDTGTAVCNPTSLDYCTLCTCLCLSVCGFSLSQHIEFEWEKNNADIRIKCLNFSWSNMRYDVSSSFIVIWCEIFLFKDMKRREMGAVHVHFCNTVHSECILMNMYNE